MHVAGAPGLSPILPLLTESVSNLPFPFSAERKIYAHSALSLVQQLFRSLKLGEKARVLAPDYHRARTMRAIRAAGMELSFYRTQRDLTADLEALERALTPEIRALYVIHHFGFPQPIEEIKALAEARGVVLIEDCTEALFSSHQGRALGSFGAHAIYDLPASLPVPDGGLLLAAGEVGEAIDQLRFRPSAWMSLLAGAVKSRGFLGRFFQTDAEEACMEMAPLTRHMLERIDFDLLPQRRRDVYSQLLHRLGDWVAPLKGELATGVCPQFLPVIIEDKGAAIEQLRARGVEAIDPGSGADLGVDERRSKDARWLREHLVGLPAHQDLGAEHVAHVVRSVRALGLSQRTGVVRAIEDAGSKVVNLLDSGALRPLSKRG